MQGTQPGTHIPNVAVAHDASAEAAFMVAATASTLRAINHIWVEADWFYLPHWAYAWETAKQLLGSGGNVDPTLITNQLRRTHGDEIAKQFWMELVRARETYILSDENCADYARLIRRAWMCRETAQIAADIAIAAATEDMTQIAALTYRLATLSDVSGDEVDSFSPSEANALLLADVEDMMHNPNAGILTGINGIDDTLGAAKAGRVYLIGAPTSVGKSMIGLCLMLNIANHFRRLDEARLRMGDEALHQSVEYFSMEMLAVDQAVRLAANQTRAAAIDYIQRGFRQTMRGTPDELAFQRFSRESSDAAKLLDGYFHWHQRPKTLAQLRMILRRAKSEGRLPRAILIDQSEYVRSEGGGELRQWYTFMYQELRDIASEFKIAVYALHQFNREASKTTTKVPTLDAFKESGGVENASDGAILLWYPHNHWPGDPGNPEEGYYADEGEWQYVHGMWLIIAKNKQGARNVWVPLRRDAEFASVGMWPDDWDLQRFIDLTATRSGHEMSEVDIYGRR